jgi:hypothetical protein
MLVGACACSSLEPRSLNACYIFLQFVDPLSHGKPIGNNTETFLQLQVPNRILTHTGPDMSEAISFPHWVLPLLVGRSATLCHKEN